MKGVRMAGRMGGDRVKLKRLSVIKIFADKNFILVSGAVPGHIGSIVYIQN
jgi:large subunit ribosomal protein L3